MACGYRPQNTELNEVFRLDKQQVTLVVASGVQDLENLGSIVRSCAAFGVDALILGRGCADPYSRRALRVSVGTAFQLPILQTNDLISVLRELKTDWNVHVAATVLDGDAERLDEATRPARFALLFGSEGFGLDENLIAECDRRITLPMGLGVDSLNVAVAAGVFLYHFTRGCRG